MALAQIQDPEIGGIMKAQLGNVAIQPGGLLELQPLNKDASGNPDGATLRLFSDPLVNGRGFLALYDSASGLTGQVYDSLVNPPPTGSGGLRGSAVYDAPAAAPVDWYAVTPGTYLFVFRCAASCSAAGIGPGVCVNFGISTQDGQPCAVASATLPQTNDAYNVATTATAIGVIPATGTYNFVASNVNIGGSTPVFTSYAGTCLAFRIL